MADAADETPEQPPGQPLEPTPGRAPGSPPADPGDATAAATGTAAGTEPTDGTRESIRADSGDAIAAATGTAADPRTASRSGRLVTRRGLLLSGAAVVVAAGAGAGAAALAPRDEPPPPPVPPADLVAALAAEQALLAGLDAAVARDASLTSLAGALRADHVAHAQALRALLPAPSTAPSIPPSNPRPAATPAAGTLDRAGLRSAEQLAAGQAAARAARLDGTAAVLLASIAACEAGHAELLA